MVCLNTIRWVAGCVFWRRRSVECRLNLCRTSRAPTAKVLSGAYAWVQDRLDAVLVTLCAYPMWWFGSLTLFLQGVSECPMPNLCKCVPLLLSFPCFYASNFFFQCAYRLGHRRLHRLGRKCAALGGQDFSLKFNHKSLDLSDRLHLAKAQDFRTSLGRLLRRRCRGVVGFERIW